ncbi:hypothetical protein C8J56DRAFT_1019405 [Mycena floridula]|nr:hypothetical protein C8J56DRAFT_1019405 [Mycena floridula]
MYLMAIGELGNFINDCSVAYIIGLPGDLTQGIESLKAQDIALHLQLKKENPPGQQTKNYVELGSELWEKHTKALVSIKCDCEKVAKEVAMTVPGSPQGRDQGIPDGMPYTPSEGIPEAFPDHGAAM